MKQFSQQLHKKATATVKLQAAEKRELKERLVAYMEYHPLPAEMKLAQKAKVVAKTGAVTADPFTMVSIPFANIFKISSLVAVFMLLVVPFVAERAVPGDTLYAVKVQFNEEVRGSLTFDTYQKVEWETERLNRRIAEARLLASEGRLTQEVEAEVATAVLVHTANAQREIAELRIEDADAATIASITLDTTLEVQSTSLKGEDDAAVALATTTALTNRPANLIADAIDQSRSESEAVKASSTLPAYGKLIARIEQNTTRIYELHSALQDIVPAKELAEVTRRVEDTDRAIMEASDVSDMSTEASRQGLVEALQRSQRLIVYMTELMVIKTVDIETLIPVVMTEVEESTKIDAVTQEVLEKTEAIRVAVAVEQDEAKVEKITFALVTIQELTNKMASTTQEFATFYTHSSEALALLNDSLLLLETKVIKPVVEVENTLESASSTATTIDEAIDEELPEETTAVDGEGIFDEVVIDEGVASFTATTTEAVIVDSL